jgi:hypothetical protein
MTPSDDTARPPERLKELVERHQVCWEVWPLYNYSSTGERAQVGFEVDISGVHHEPGHVPMPGCDECERVFRALREIAIWARPDPKDETEHVIHGFDRRLRESPKRGHRDDVELQLMIEHRTGYERPVDACEVACLRTIERRLAALGAGKGRWRGRSR